MYTCDECGTEFGLMSQLARHIKKEHRSTPTVKKTSAVQAPCPVCDFKLPYTTASADWPRTICPVCLSQYDQIKGELFSPPPQKCIYELYGLPCGAPEHKKWYYEYSKKGG